MGKVKTDFLFAQPSFVSGAARALDLWGVLDDYNISATTLEADEKAIAADWLVVGQDLADAIEQQEFGTESCLIFVSKNRNKIQQNLPRPNATIELTHQSVSFSGPLPHPALLAKYNEVVPNGAERIMAMAERQSIPSGIFGSPSCR